MLLSQLDSYKKDITAVQEIRWTGEVIIDKKDHIIFYSCDRKKHMFRTGFIVDSFYEGIYQIYEKCPKRDLNRSRKDV